MTKRLVEVGFRGGAVALAYTLLIGCTGDSGPGMVDHSTSDTDTTGLTSLSGTESDSGDTETESDSDSDSSGGSTTGVTGGTDKLCKFIDFVFVVDNSGSMADEQANLVAAVPGFVDAMETAFPTVENFRVGVVDTDTYPGIASPDDPLDACPDATDCSVCDYRLGTFLNKPASAVDQGTSCNFSTNARHMDGESPAFADEFECAALVGTDGNPVEQQIGALVDSLSPEAQAAGGCNEGFVRDNALLVFLVITDEEDDKALPPGPQGGSLGDPQRWYDAVIEAKDGKAPNAVALALTGGSPLAAGCEQLMGADGAEETPRITEFIEKFETNFIGNVCEDGYDTFFNEALEKVAEGCMKFIP